jgi:enamine deaminase RidA (YjgF/YER057c/UK114 family)
MSVRPIMRQVVKHNGVVYLAGQVARNSPDGDVAEQTREILAAIDRLLAEAGTDKTRLLQAQIWLTDIATQFSAMNEVWNAWVDEKTAPARACVEARLAAPQYKVEIMVTAAA